MIKKLIHYVEQLFENAPQTNRVSDLKDELKANLIEKYNDLLAKGKSEEEAYNIVVAGIGDINELINQIEGSEANKHDVEKERKKSALLLTTAVVLYILCVVPVILTATISLLNPVMGVALMFVFIAVATGLLVYRSASVPPYIKADETLVEEFKEWKSQRTQKNSFRKSIYSAYWLIVVAIYFIVSFSLGIWSYSWIIFIIAAAIQKVIEAVYELRDEK